MTVHKMETRPCFDVVDKSLKAGLYSNAHFVTSIVHDDTATVLITGTAWIWCLNQGN